MTKPFSFIKFPKARSTEKPRSKGLTMVVDFGLSIPQQRALLEMASSYIDLGKVAVGSARLYEESYLREKLDLYKSFQVRPFVGGQFLEFVVGTEGVAGAGRFFKEAARVGFEVVEVSDNTVPLTPEQRRELIRMGIDNGLSIFGEVGSKNDVTDLQVLLGQASDAFEAGAELVLVEAAELAKDGKPDREMIDAIRAELDVSKVLFELGGPWISGVTLSEVYDFKKFLIHEFGPDVNMANIKPDDVIDLETNRVGLGPAGILPGDWQASD